VKGTELERDSSEALWFAASWSKVEVALWRLTRRTARRWLRNEELWNGNRETLRAAFWGRDSLVAWAILTHFRHRRDWPTELAGRPLVRLRTAREVARWLSELSPIAPRQAH
jgi:hypothetical protein